MKPVFRSGGPAPVYQTRTVNLLDRSDLASRTNGMICAISRRQGYCYSAYNDHSRTLGTHRTTIRHM